MALTNKELYKALDFFKNITVYNLLELSKINFDNREEIDDTNFFDKTLKSEVFQARVSVSYDIHNHLFHYSINPYNRGFEFCFVAKDDEIIKSFFRKSMNLKIRIENNDEELSNISQQVYSFVKEQNKHFEKDIIKEKVENF